MIDSRNDQSRYQSRVRSLGKEYYLGNFYGCAFGYFAWINELVKLGVFRE